MLERKVKAVRGAASVDNNGAEAILASTRALLESLVRANGLDPRETISMFFTLTSDLNATFPALAAREAGFSAVPLMCAQEIEVPGALPRVVRVLIHFTSSRDPQPIYLGAAKQLRADLHLNPEEIFVALRELEERGGLSAIGAEALMRRAWGKTAQDPLRTEERDVFSRGIRSLQLAGRIGCRAYDGAHSYFTIAEPQ